MLSSIFPPTLSRRSSSVLDLFETPAAHPRRPAQAFRTLTFEDIDADSHDEASSPIRDPAPRAATPRTPSPSLRRGAALAFKADVIVIDSDEGEIIFKQRPSKHKASGRVSANHRRNSNYQQQQQAVPKHELEHENDAEDDRFDEFCARLQAVKRRPAIERTESIETTDTLGGFIVNDDDEAAIEEGADESVPDDDNDDTDDSKHAETPGESHDDAIIPFTFVACSDKKAKYHLCHVSPSGQQLYRYKAVASREFEASDRVLQVHKTTVLGIIEAKHMQPRNGRDLVSISQPLNALCEDLLLGQVIPSRRSSAGVPSKMSSSQSSDGRLVTQWRASISAIVLALSGV